MLQQALFSNTERANCKYRLLKQQVVWFYINPNPGQWQALSVTYKNQAQQDKSEAVYGHTKERFNVAGSW